METLMIFSTWVFHLMFVFLALTSVLFGPSIVVILIYWAITDEYIEYHPIRGYIWCGLAVFLLILMLPFGVKVAEFFTKQDEPQIPVETVKIEIRQFKLLHVYPPKQMYVDFQDVETGQIFNRIYVTSYCSGWSNNTVGDQYSIPVAYEKQGEKQWIEFNNLYRTFCNHD